MHAIDDEVIFVNAASLEDGHGSDRRSQSAADSNQPLDTPTCDRPLDLTSDPVRNSERSLSDTTNGL
jgi:hypothetical protein